MSTDRTIGFQIKISEEDRRLLMALAGVAGKTKGEFAYQLFVQAMRDQKARDEAAAREEATKEKSSKLRPVANRT